MLMLATLSAAMLCGADPADLKALEGRWTVASMEQEGQTYPAKLSDEIRLEVAGGRFTFIQGKIQRFDTRVSGLDPSANPSAIDLTRRYSDKSAPSGFTERTVKGIYKLEGDTLTICTTSRGDRPASFATRPGSANVLTVYRRGETPKAVASTP